MAVTIIGIDIIHHKPPSYFDFILQLQTS